MLVSRVELHFVGYPCLYEQERQPDIGGGERQRHPRILSREAGDAVGMHHHDQEQHFPERQRALPADSGACSFCQ
jgi:hypothetical protein